MTIEIKADILIAGAGPSGTALAYSLITMVRTATLVPTV